MAKNYACLCCGYSTLPQPPPGTWDICPVCFWEDVPIDANWIQNQVALRQAQRTFLQISASHEDWLDDVRPPAAAEARSNDWQPLDEQDKTAREALIRDITEAFRSVKREDGVTLHQALVLDNYGSAAEQAAARTLDTDIHWWDVSDKCIETLPSPLSFLDPIGFRYYIPAYMIWTLRHYQTSRSDTAAFTIYAFLIYENLREHKLRYFEIMNRVQSQVVCRFLQYFTTFGANAIDSQAAQRALAEYWNQFCRDTAI